MKRVPQGARFEEESSSVALLRRLGGPVVLAASLLPVAAADGPGTGVDNGVDPLYFRHRAELVATTTDFDAGSLHRIRTVTLRGDWTPAEGHLLRLDVPHDEPEFAGGSETSDFGDLVVRYLRRREAFGPFGGLAWGSDGIIPTGDLMDGTGGAQWGLAPLVILGHYRDGGLGIFPTLQFTKTLANDEPGAPSITELSGRVPFTLSRRHWWVELEPEVIVDFERDAHASLVGGVGVGVQFSRKWAAFASARHTLDADPPRFDTQLHFGLRFLPQ